MSPTGEVTTIATHADGLDWASSIAFGKNGDLWAVNFAIGPIGGPGAGSPAARRRDERTAGTVGISIDMPAATGLRRSDDYSTRQSGSPIVGGAAAPSRGAAPVGTLPGM